MPETVQWSEVVWTLCALAAALHSLGSLVDALEDAAALRALGLNGARRRLARLIVVMECSRLAIALVAVVTGGLMMTTPYSGTPAAQYVHVGMVVICAVLVCATGYSRSTRRAILRHMLDNERDETGQGG